jgi:hypothetical protein
MYGSVIWNQFHLAQQKHAAAACRIMKPFARNERIL